jgi:methionyl-tRNA formyltransferase
MKRLLGMYGVVPFVIQAVRVVFLRGLSLFAKFFPIIEYKTISQMMKQRGITCARVSNINSDKTLALLNNFKIDLIVSIAVPQIFKKPLLDLPSIGCINVHGGYLPDYRGVFSSFWVLCNNESTTGASVHYMTQGIDDGEIIAQGRLPITSEDSVDSLCFRTADLGIDLLCDSVNLIRKDEVLPIPNETGKGRYNSFPKSQDRKVFRSRGKRYF